MAEQEQNTKDIHEQAAQNETPEQETTAAAEPENTDTENDNQGELSLDIQLLEARDKHMRLYAEFDNYRKRTNREKADLIKNAGEGLMKDLLPVIDDFERAKKAADQAEDKGKAYQEGFDIVFGRLMKVLEKKGLKEIENPTGQPLDVDKHEAITQIPAPDESLKGKVIDQIEKGYYLNDKIIRFAKVVTGA